MLDLNFKCVVVLFCEYGEEGSVGFIMNKLFDMQIDVLVEFFLEFEFWVFYGGLVQCDIIYYLYMVGDLLEGSCLVGNGIYWGGDFEKLKFLVIFQFIEFKDICFFVGYFGWLEGQFDDEMIFGFWVVVDMYVNYFFNMNFGKVWEQVMYNKGDVYMVIVNMLEFVSWNQFFLFIFVFFKKNKFFLVVKMVLKGVLFCFDGFCFFYGLFVLVVLLVFFEVILFGLVLISSFMQWLCCSLN